MNRMIGLSILMVSMATFALAGIRAPEIDATSGAAAIGLLSGGILILRSRKKRS